MQHAAPVSVEELWLKRWINERHFEYPFYGARLAKQLEREGFDVGRLHVTTLMRRMASRICAADCGPA